jgi:hypothetical protein
MRNSPEGTTKCADEITELNQDTVQVNLLHEGGDDPFSN